MAYHLLIDGRLVGAATMTDVVNPATGQPFESAPRADEAQAEHAIAAANEAFPGWAALSYEDRGAYVRGLADALEAAFEPMADLLTREQGKPIAEARMEVGASIAALRYHSDLRVEPRILRDAPDEHIVEQRYPLGVVAAITPWNYPLLLLMFKLAPALMAGNTVIAKPAPTTPLTTLRLGALAASIMPRGVFQTLADENDIGPLLTSHPDIHHVAFTGSTVTGKAVARSASATLKRLNLELGGNDAALVLDDAAVDVVAPKIFQAAMLNAGQVCLAAKRLYVPRAMMDAMCAALGQLADAAVVGDGRDPSTTIGPIQNRAQYEKVLGFVEEARRQGTVVAGGALVEGDGYFIRPTIVRDLPHDARLVREEQFGPILPVIAYDDLDAAIALINDTPYGLSGTVWTSDPERGQAVASRFESGLVWVNRHMAVAFDVPMGGAKQSGLGRQLGLEGVEEFTQARIINAALV